MGDWGMRVSQEGFDVKSCADYELVMSSSFNMLKNALVGTAIGTTFIPHGLGYAPILFPISILSGVTSGIVGQNVGSNPYYVGCDGVNVAVWEGTVKYYVFHQEG